MSLQSAFPVQHQYSEPPFNQASWAQQTYASAALGSSSLSSSLSTSALPHAAALSASTIGSSSISSTSLGGTSSTSTTTSTPSQTSLYNSYNSSPLEQSNVLNPTNQFGYNMAQISPNQHGVGSQQSAVWSRHTTNNKMAENLTSWHENYR